MSQRVWEKEEEDIVMEMSGKCPLSEITSKLGRSKDSVMKKIWRMGLNRYSPSYHPKWTEQQLEQLRTNADHMTVHQFSQEHGLSDDQVYNMAERNGIKFIPAKYWTPERDEILKSCKTLKEASGKLDKNPDDIFRHAQRMGVDLIPFVKWTPAMIETLRNAGTYENAAELLDKDVDKVIRMSKKLGIVLSGGKNSKELKPAQKRIKKTTSIKRKKVINYGHIEWCPNCHSPVSNWGEHWSRMPECKKGRAA